MLLCKVALIVFIISMVKAQRADRYIIPEPKIEAFSPAGFRVSIEDSPGMRLFAFHGNINSELRRLEAGRLSKDVLHKENGRWAFEDRSARLVVGDTIYYWLFVVKEELGFYLDDRMFRVRELLPSPFPTTTPSSSEGFYPRPTLPPSNGKPSQMDPNEPSELPLTKVIERTQGAKKLTLGGRIPPDGDAVQTVTFLLRERLGLKPDIVSAERSGNTIVFEVGTLAEKLEILDVAPEKLKNTKVTIT